MIKQTIIAVLLAFIISTAGVIAQDTSNQYLQPGLLFNDGWICVPRPEPAPKPADENDK